MCHCEDGWKGAECDIPLGDCQVPDCNQHGQCVRGSCVCNPGWKGAFCNERKFTFEIKLNLTINCICESGYNIHTYMYVYICKHEMFSIALKHERILKKFLSL